MLAVEFNTDELQQKLNGLAGQLTGKQMKRALYLAVNQTAKQVRTQSDREIRRIYNIRQSFILKYIKIKNANESKLFADVSLPTKPVPMGEFMGVRGGRGVRKAKKISIEIIKGKRFTLNGAFLFQSKFSGASSKLSIMHRSNAAGNKSYIGGSFQFRHKRVSPSGKDLPIGAMFSVSPFSSVFNQIVRQQIVLVGSQKLQQNTLTMLDKMAMGYIKAANSKGRTR